MDASGMMRELTAVVMDMQWTEMTMSEAVMDDGTGRGTLIGDEDWMQGDQGGGQTNARTGLNLKRTHALD